MVGVGVPVAMAYLPVQISVPKLFEVLICVTEVYISSIISLYSPWKVEVGLIWQSQGST